MQMRSFLARLLGALVCGMALCTTPAQTAETDTPQPNLLQAIGNLIGGGQKSSSESPATRGPGIGPASRNLAVGGAEKRVALVIGNSSYVQGALKNPVNDARAMSSKLRGLGFEVVVHEDLKTKDIGSVYRNFRSKIAPGSIALVFYAGHGVQIKGQNFFPAVDSEIAAEEDVPLQSLNLGTLLDNMEEAKAGVSLVFLDACRDNPFARRFRNGARGLTKVDAPAGTLIHYATRPGAVASDGESMNGTYTEALLAEIGEPGIPIEQILKRVTNRVINKSSGKQEPWGEGQLRGDFYFISQGAPAVNVQRAAADPDSEAWSAAQRANTEGGYRVYLEAYPAGQFVTAAKIALDALTKPVPVIEPTKPEKPSPSAPVAVDDPESALWSEVKQSGAKEYFEAYLKQYPKGKYAVLARTDLRKIDDKEKAEKAREDAERKVVAERERNAHIKADQDAWESTRNARTVAAYSDYLNRFPQGRYVALAQAGKQIAEREAADRAEMEHWRRVDSASDSSTVQGYLDRYPNGRYLNEARTKLAAVKQTEYELHPGKIFRDCAECPEMVVVPAGSFDMGNSKSIYNEERPVHSVRIPRPFAIGKTEVTQKLWRMVMGADPPELRVKGCDDCPVGQVSWDDAQDFVKKLSQKTGKSYRLPSEAEWEYACRAGEGHEYCGDANIDSVAWYFKNSDGQTRPVARKQANTWGLHDMSGNVREWVEDCWNGSYNGAPGDGSAWTNGNCSGRVLRGGSWFNFPGDMRVTFRGRSTTGYRSDLTGFRLARTISP